MWGQPFACVRSGDGDERVELRHSLQISTLSGSRVLGSLNCFVLDCVTDLPPKAADLHIYLPDWFSDGLTVSSRLAPRERVLRATLAKPSGATSRSTKSIRRASSRSRLAVTLGCDCNYISHSSIQNIHQIMAEKAPFGRT